LVNLKLDKISCSYLEHEVLNDISFEVNSGEVLAIVGCNGVGKSTLLKCINRILKPTLGKVLLDNIDLSTMKVKDLAKKVAFLEQNNSFSFPISVFDVVFMGRFPHYSWTSGNRDNAIVWQMLDLINIRDIAQRDFCELSGGEQQKVLLARVLAQEAEILLLDEPTSDLDIKYQIEVMEIIKKLVKEQNKAAVISLHDLNLAASYADKVVMLSNGMVFAAGSPEVVLTCENLEKVYGVSVQVIKHNEKPLIILGKR
jgi:iron complex transport system ATP-binding protein